MASSLGAAAVPREQYICYLSFAAAAKKAVPAGKEIGAFFGYARPRRLGERTGDYGLAAMDFCGTLPRTAAGRHEAACGRRQFHNSAVNF